MISIKGIKKNKILAALYNNSKPLCCYSSKPMTEKEAEKILDESKDMNFDYLKGRVMKIDLSKDFLNPDLYDRDNGAGAAQKVINTLTKDMENNFIKEYPFKLRRETEYE